jgi:3',5'-cyclic AMP phosphodiesterase CpdA
VNGLRLAHVTDLHFGEADPAMAALLAEDVRAAKPDAILNSGDLTRRAERREFAAAWEFMNSLGAPVLAVPGNHDISPSNLIQRFFSPRRRWHGGLPEGSVQELTLPGVSIFGLDTVRRAHWHLDWSAGGVSDSRMARLRARLRGRAEPRCLLLCHHPLRHPAALAWRRLPVNTRHLLKLLREEGVEAILSGHLHVPQVLRGTAGDPIQVITPSGLSARGSGKCGWSLITLLDGRFTIHAREFRDGAWSAGAITSLSETPSPPAPAVT